MAKRPFFEKFVVAGDGFIPLRSIGYGFLRVAQTGAFQSPNPCTEPPLFGGSNPTQHTLNKKYTYMSVFVRFTHCAATLNFSLKNGQTAIF